MANAQKVLADFLQQPEKDISCTELFGGSEEGTIFKCTHQESNYVIKFFTNQEAGKNEIAWTRHASKLGIGPNFFYADPYGSHMITAFAQGNSLVIAMVNLHAIIRSIAANLAKLHHSSAPFAHASDLFERIDTKYKKLHRSGNLKDILETKWHTIKKIEAQIKHVSGTPVPCHNDLNWGNIFADNNRVAFIDWGDAALGNPYYDIAAFFVLNCVSTENEKLFFEQYNSELLKPQWQTYIQSLKQMVYFEFALNLLLGVQAGKKGLLEVQETPNVKHLSYYLTSLAKKEVKVDSEFLYQMAIASLALL